MAEVKIRIPSKISANDVILVRSLVPHPMEIIQRDKDGKMVDKNYNFIHTVIATYNGKEIVRGQMTQSVSANPFFSFPLKVTAPGTLVITFEDTSGAKHTGKVDIKF
jgi:sulfur-oxidizing protein SoxZ